MQRRTLEKISLAVIALLTLTLVGTSIHFEREVGRQKALFYELQLLRTTVQLYKSIRHANPPSLEALAMEEYQFPGEEVSRRFLEYPPSHDEQKLSDPFGTPYAYDQESAWVKSATQGYEQW